MGMTQDTPYPHQRKQNADTSQAVQQVPQVAGTAQLAAFLHSCSVPLNVTRPLHVPGVV